MLGSTVVSIKTVLNAQILHVGLLPILIQELSLLISSLCGISTDSTPVLGVVD